MNTQKDLSVYHRYGYKDGYRGLGWTMPEPSKGPEHPANKEYMRGYNEGKKKFNKLKGGVDCLL